MIAVPEMSPASTLAKSSLRASVRHRLDRQHSTSERPLLRTPANAARRSKNKAAADLLGWMEQRENERARWGTSGALRLLMMQRNIFMTVFVAKTTFVSRRRTIVNKSVRERVCACVCGSRDKFT